MKMSDPRNQEKMIKETVDKVHSTINKFIFDTFYSDFSSGEAIALRNGLEEIKAKILKREKQIKKKN